MKNRFVSEAFALEEVILLFYGGMLLVYYSSLPKSSRSRRNKNATDNFTVNSLVQAEN